MNHKLFVFLFLACCVAFASCVPESDNPLSDAKTASLDARLYGLWSTTHSDGGTQYLHIGPLPAADNTSGGGWMQCWSVTHNAQNREVAKPYEARFYRTEIGDAIYANVLNPDGQAAGRGAYWFYKYRVNGNQLETWLMSLQQTAKAIDAGHIKGVVERDGDQITKVRLTDTTENLVDWLRNTDANLLFPDEHRMTYLKVGQ